MLLGRRRAAPSANADTWAVLGLLLLAFVPYLNALTGAFVYDDRPQLLDNPYVHSFQYLKQIFGSTVWTFQGEQGVTNYYRPLMSFTYLLGYRLFGEVAFGFHLFNLTLHAGVVLLLFGVTQRLFGDRLLSFIAAGLFALHPIHTESVAWIAGITDLQLSVFSLLTFFLYLELGMPQAPRIIPAALLMAYVLALLSKEQALVLPLLAAAYEHFYRPDRSATPLRQKILRYAPLFLMAAAYLAFRAFGLGGFAPAVSRPEMSGTAVLVSALALLGQYLWKLLWPLHLSAFYVFHESQRLSEPQVIAGLAGFLACLILFLWLWRRERLVSFALLWMGATLAPVLNARWMPAGVFAERYLYLPSVGFCWLVAWAAVKVWRSAPAAGSAAHPGLLRRSVPIALAALALLYGVRTVGRNRDWRTEEVLYRRTLEEQPDAQVIRTNLGAVYFDRGDLASAEREWQTALGPRRPYASTLNNLGLLRTRQKRYDEAIGFFERAIRERPKYMSPHKNLAHTYVEMGRPLDAEREFHTAVELAPLSADARNEFGKYLLDRGRPAEAHEQFALSAQADPNSEAQIQLGSLLASAGDSEAARAAYRGAVALDPFDSRAHFGLAALEERAGRYAEAVRAYRAGLETDPSNAQALKAFHRLANKAGNHRPVPHPDGSPN